MDTRSLASFADEMVKISVGDDTDFRPSESRRRLLLDAGAGALGFGLGYGLGAAGGRLLGNKYPHAKWVPLAVGGIGAAGTLMSRLRDRQGQRYVDEPFESSRERGSSEG